MAYFLSWVAAFFDLSVGFLFLFRRTRILAMALTLIFHGTNHFLIFKDIDWFPLLGVLTALIFFDPDWPERLWNWLKRPSLSKPDWARFFAGGILLPVIGAALGWKLRPRSIAAQAQQSSALSAMDSSNQESPRSAQMEPEPRLNSPLISALPLPSSG